MAKGFATQVKLNELNRLSKLTGLPGTVPGGLGRAEERALVRAAQGGDTKALRRILSHVMGPVYRYGIGFCRDPDDASDVSQDVMLALVRNLRRFRGEASLLTWAYVVTRRACTRHRRRRVGEPSAIETLGAEESDDGSQALEVASDDPGPDRDVERRELRRTLESALASLPRPQREVVLLRDVEGFSTREVARTLRLGERAVKSRLHRARSALRLKLRGARASTGDVPVQAGRTCPDTALLLSRYLEGELNASVCTILAKHVAACSACAATCADLRFALRECRQYGRAPLPEHARHVLREAIRSTVKALAG